MCTCITFCWTKQLSKTTSIGPVAFEGRELCAFGLHSAGPDSYLTLLLLVPWSLKDGSYVQLYYILLDQTVIYNTTLIGPVTVTGRKLYVLVLHSAGPDSYLQHYFDWPVSLMTEVICTGITFGWT